MRRAVGAGETSPELALLLACARLRLDEGDRRAAAGALARGVDWRALRDLAWRHGLTGLLHRHVAAGALGRDAVPAPALAVLEREALAVARRGLYLAGELVGLLRAFATAGIPVVPLKGPVVAETVYGSVGLRRFNDLDLLCHPADVARAVAVLADRGFAPTRGAADGAGVDPCFEAFENHVVMVAPSRGYRVEVHRALFAPVARPSVGLAEIAPSLVTASVLGHRVQTLPPEELLAYLCLHGHVHAWARLEWLCAVGVLMRDARLRDWERVRSFAALLSGTMHLECGIEVARTLLRASGPEAPAASRRAAASARWLVDRIRRDPGAELTPTERLRHDLRGDVRAVDRARRIWRVLFSAYPADLLAVPLPRPLRPLYRVLRPARLVLRQARRVAGRVRRPVRPPGG